MKITKENLKQYFEQEVSRLKLEKLKLKFRYNEKIKWYYGCFNEVANTVVLSSSIHELPKEEIIQTIRHELAHAIDWHRNGKKWRKHPSGRYKFHDKVWKDICVEIGCEPKRF